MSGRGHQEQAVRFADRLLHTRPAGEIKLHLIGSFGLAAGGAQHRLPRRRQLPGDFTADGAARADDQGADMICVLRCCDGRVRADRLWTKNGISSIIHVCSFWIAPWTFSPNFSSRPLVSAPPRYAAVAGRCCTALSLRAEHWSACPAGRRGLIHAPGLPAPLSLKAGDIALMARGVVHSVSRLAVLTEAVPVLLIGAPNEAASHESAHDENPLRMTGPC